MHFCKFNIHFEMSPYFVFGWWYITCQAKRWFFLPLWLPFQANPCHVSDFLNIDLFQILHLKSNKLKSLVSFLIAIIVRKCTSSNQISKLLMLFCWRYMCTKAFESGEKIQKFNSFWILFWIKTEHLKNKFRTICLVFNPE